jgi:uncharacterized membrane protein
VSRSSRYLAFFAYLLSLPGALYILGAHRRDRFAAYHARQSLAIALIALGAPLAWFVVGWLLAWFPFVGPVAAAALFALVIAVFAGLAVDSLIGMAYALQGRVRAVPLAGRLASRLPISVGPHAPAAEPVERATTIDA